MTKWAEVSVHTTQEAIEAVANILHEAGASGVVIEDAEDLKRLAWQKQAEAEQYLVELNPEDYPKEGVILKAYFPMNSFLGETIEEIKTALNNLLLHDINLGRGTVTMTEVYEEDWAHAWKKYYKPARISDKITITPTWEDYQPQTEEEQVIELDPGMAFGTGTHPTTILCIRALEKYVRQGDRVIDVGCGSGVLSIAAVKLGAGQVLALDIDELAVKVTRENVKLNGVANQVQVKQNNLLDHINQEADVIVANILAEVILRFVKEAYALLRHGGYFITSGIIFQKKEAVQEALVSHGFTIVETVFMEDWVAMIAKKE
ncbi:ribosomal protein L11 methyltransferase [Caldalkalibacillus thermarum]|uniref:50S ribosomal protein L11 methyltransferase n=1 Tax=Caldalkalibacillus thermarum TaxID=296745 RepID=UPI001667D908|nr:50S ribosomal protein L11 methyltransferase [Caldalkalibacillus thermarum]GGK18440.1 ribosomal protein L11 methyltransferase [Caldalkalibacillus thermarum]